MTFAVVLVLVARAVIEVLANLHWAQCDRRQDL
jgi:hypothetical protein